MKQWLGVDAKISATITYIEDYMRVMFGNDWHETKIKTSIDALIKAYKEQIEINERLNAENKALIKYGVVSCANLKGSKNEQ